MKRVLSLSLISLVFTFCKRDEPSKPVESEELAFISAVDISSYPEIASANHTFYDLDGTSSDFLNILKENGVNTIRLRLWITPSNDHSGFEEVKKFSKTLKDLGLKTWLTLHYSNTWADPAHQEIPSQWQGLHFDELTDSVYSYTKSVLQEMEPNFIQIGNEINAGFLHPDGHISEEYEHFITLMRSGISAVRETSPNCKIILHYAGLENADWFYKQVSALDYDIIGLSYYPKWHGKSLGALKNTMERLGESYQKKIVIAETAYPFTLDWNDFTNNIVGLEEQLILPEYPATVDGQKNFINSIKRLTVENENAVGFCYWGAELIAWKGAEATDASPWENQALFDFDNHALPALSEFNTE